MDHYTEKWASGSTPLDHSPHGAPRQPARPPKTLPDPAAVTRERKKNRQDAWYRSQTKPTPEQLRRSKAIGGD